MIPSRLHLLLSLFSLPAALGLPGFGAVRLALDAAPKAATVAQACPEGSSSHSVDSVSFFLESGIKMTTGSCAPSNSTLAARAARGAVASSPLPDGREPGDECDTPCKTVCFDGHKSPDAADCQVIFDALLTRDDRQFCLHRTDGFVLYTFKSCGTSFTNQIVGSDEPQPLNYCYRDWAGAGHWVANACQSDSEAAGGKCVAAFGSFQDVPDWYMQVYNT
ncbi:hypothetical protein EXIGLDRAFT_749194 [Exidia glandulosa HHB12029]|uniref:Uncharacterized protein n=1 Tax=Exidia glandulosa HHB12029 TaxID=1314781 RepID=A0A165IGD6_EXIGL|nr:hypothetical protein EXIGLDRAFT_749194 [Exidia glandulosa HHB12029]